MNVTFTEICDYFEPLAASHKKILFTADNSRFFPSWDEALEKYKKVKFEADRCIMILDEADVRGVGAHNDTNHAARRFTLFILTPCHKKDYSVIDAAYNLCEQVYRDMLSHIRYDKEEGTNDNLLSQFEVNNYTAERIGPLIDGWYGYACDLTMQHNVELDYDASKWQ